MKKINLRKIAPVCGAVFAVVILAVVIVRVFVLQPWKWVRVSAKDLMGGKTVDVNVSKPDDETLNKVDGFAMKLFSACYDGKNMMVSPISVFAALGMTANGAANETLEAMEKTLGMTADEAKNYMAALTDSLKDDKQMALANSIWFSDSAEFTVNEDFLNENRGYYKASVFKAPFNARTLKDVNNWVYKNTDGKIDKILEDISGEDVMFLINALSFDAKWEVKYEKDKTREDDFTKEDGSKVRADYMISEEKIYLETEKATGFIKPYKDGKYGFLALLPNEGVTVSDLVASLNGSTYKTMIDNRINDSVDVRIPKFESEYESNMNSVLESLGMGIAFDLTRADFSRMGKSSSLGFTHIDEVIHKTYISVDENGTKAKAVTLVRMKCASAIAGHEVYLNRPFIYMIIDMETGVPYFTGVMMDEAAN